MLVPRETAGVFLRMLHADAVNAVRRRTFAATAALATFGTLNYLGLWGALGARAREMT